MRDYLDDTYPGLFDEWLGYYERAQLDHDAVDYHQAHLELTIARAGGLRREVAPKQYVGLTLGDVLITHTPPPPPSRKRRQAPAHKRPAPNPALSPAYVASVLGLKAPPLAVLRGEA